MVGSLRGGSVVDEGLLAIGGGLGGPGLLGESRMGLGSVGIAARGGR